MTGCIGGKRYLRPQVLDRCQDCWKGGNVLGSSWTWCYKGEQSRDGVVFSINPSAGRFSQRYLLEIRIGGLTQAKIALLHHVGGGKLGGRRDLGRNGDSPNAEIVAFSVNPDN